MFLIFPTYSNLKTVIRSIIENFNTQGTVFIAGKRNTIKLFKVNELLTLNIKLFRKPIKINQFIYKYFRKSKAKRSYEYANKLLEYGIGTPQPIAFFEKFSWFGLKSSYYVSQHLDTELTFRELVEIPDYPNHDIILRQFTQFSFRLHEKGVEFLDHSPGNTLIEKMDENLYEFYLVDLNRMRFHSEMDFDQRMKNLSRLTPKKEMIAVMSNEYSKLYPSKTEEEIFEKMWFYTNEFQVNYHKKQNLKKKFKFKK